MPANSPGAGIRSSPVTSHFDASLERLLRIEGGYSAHVHDRGGPTHWGITERVARANGYFDDMREMPLSVAREIYRRQYWSACRLDDIAAHSPELADRLFDIGVNMGPGIAGNLLQRCLNALNRGAKDYADIKVDNIIGTVTLYALRGYLTRRGAPGGRVLVELVKDLQAARYVSITEISVTQEDFLFGWIRQRILQEP